LYADNSPKKKKKPPKSPEGGLLNSVKKSIFHLLPVLSNTDYFKLLDFRLNTIVGVLRVNQTLNLKPFEPFEPFKPFKPSTFQP
jgi:hypothetical protein